MSNRLIKPQNNDIIIDDGIKVYNIKNLRGKLLGTFEFRPADTNIVNRYEEVVDFFNNLSIPESENAEETVEEAEKQVVEKMDYLIGGDSKAAFFSIMGAFSVLASGELFFENVLGAVAKVIEREFSVRTKKLQRRMNKYVAKYNQR